MVPFIRKVSGPKNTTQAQIMEKGSDRKNRVIKHVGTAHNQAELTALMGKAHELLHPGQQSLDLHTDIALSHCRGRITSKRSALLWDVQRGAYRQLGLDALDDERFEQMVLARLIQPASKAATVGILEDIGVKACHENTFYNSLKRCAQRNYRDDLARLCFSHASKAGDITLLLYDVTTCILKPRKKTNQVMLTTGYAGQGFQRNGALSRKSWSACELTEVGFPLK